MDRTHELVVQHALVIVHVAGVVRVEAIQVLGEFRQIVGAAGLVDVRIREDVAVPVGHHAGVQAHHLGIGLAEHLSVAHAAHRIGVAALDHLPEVAGDVVVIGVSTLPVHVQGTHDHRDMLVRVAGADIVDVLGKRVVESRRVEALRRLQETGLLDGIGHHRGQAGKRLLHAADLAGDVHIPHLIAVAGPRLALRLVAVRLHIRPVMQPVPHPEAHVLRDDERLRGNGRIVDIHGDVNQAGQLLVDRIVRGPNPLLVVVGGVFFDENGMLGGDGVDVAVAVLPAIFLVLVEGRPGALQRLELFLRNEVAGLEIPAQRVAPHKGHFLAGAEFIDHPPDAVLQFLPGRRIVGSGKCEGEGRHVVARAVSLQFRGRGIPTVGDGVTLRREPVSVSVVVQLLGYIQRKEVLYIQVTVPCESVVADEADASERKRFRHRRGARHASGTGNHLNLRLQRIAVVRGIVAQDISLHGIGSSGREGGLFFLGFPEGIGPFDLPPFAGVVGIGHPDLVRQARGGSLWRFHQDGSRFADGPRGFLAGAGGQRRHGQDQQQEKQEGGDSFHPSG